MTIVAGALTFAWLVMLIGAPAASGVQLTEPLDMSCMDKFAELRPHAAEPAYSAIEASWSWTPPGLTCTHPEVGTFVGPTVYDTVWVGIFGLVVLTLTVGPAAVWARALWRGGADTTP